MAKNSKPGGKGCLVDDIYARKKKVRSHAEKRSNYFTKNLVTRLKVTDRSNEFLTYDHTISDVPGNVAAFGATGDVNKEDYRDLVIPAMMRW